MSKKATPKQKKTMEAIAYQVKKLRLESGYKSYEKFAFDHDLPRVQYWRMEKGTNFTIKGLMRILAIHKVSLSEFFNSVNNINTHLTYAELTRNNRKMEAKQGTLGI